MANEHSPTPPPPPPPPPLPSAFSAFTPIAGPRPRAKVLDDDDRDLVLAFIERHDCQCPACSYYLKGQRSPDCPECGAALALHLGAADSAGLPGAGIRSLGFLAAALWSVATTGFLVLTIGALLAGAEPRLWPLMLAVSGVMVFLNIRSSRKLATKRIARTRLRRNPDPDLRDTLTVITFIGVNLAVPVLIVTVALVL